MFLVGILSWWYGKGLANRILIIKGRLIKSADTFSFGLLFRTLFNPFRQISADSVGESFAQKASAWFDKLISRGVGSVVRLFMIVFGLAVMFLQVLFGLMILIFWLILPILPVAGLILSTLKDTL